MQMLKLTAYSCKLRQSTALASGQVKGGKLAQRRGETTPPGAHTLKLHNASFGEALSSHANAQAHSIKLQASAEHGTGE
jgi:hypothetical protein